MRFSLVFGFAILFIFLPFSRYYCFAYIKRIWSCMYTVNIKPSDRVNLLVFFNPIPEPMQALFLANMGFASKISITTYYTYVLYFFSQLFWLRTPKQIFWCLFHHAKWISVWLKISKIKINSNLNRRQQRAVAVHDKKKLGVVAGSSHRTIFRKKISRSDYCTYKRSHTWIS